MWLYVVGTNIIKTFYKFTWGTMFDVIVDFKSWLCFGLKRKIRESWRRRWIFFYVNITFSRSFYLNCSSRQYRLCFYWDFYSLMVFWRTEEKNGKVQKRLIKVKKNFIFNCTKTTVTSTWVEHTKLCQVFSVVN